MPDYGNPLWLSPVSVPLSLILNLEKQFAEMLLRQLVYTKSPHCCWYGPATQLKIQQTSVWLHKRLIDWRLLCSLYSQRGGGAWPQFYLYNTVNSSLAAIPRLCVACILCELPCAWCCMFRIWPCDHSLLWYKYVCFGMQKLYLFGLKCLKSISKIP